MGIASTRGSLHDGGKDSGADEEEEEYVENGEDDVESHYEPVAVAPGVKLQARAGGRTTAVLDDDVEAIYKKWVDDRIKTAVASRSCTFIYTDRIYASQKWYQCKTCLASGKFRGPESGACEVCKDLCHKGHELGPENGGDFVCSCGETKCVVAQTAKERDVFADYKTLLAKVIEKERKEAPLSFTPLKPLSEVPETSTPTKNTPPSPSALKDLGVSTEEEPLRKAPRTPTTPRTPSPLAPRTPTTPRTPSPLSSHSPKVKPRSVSRAADESTLEDSRRQMDHEIRKERARSGSFQG